MSYLEMFKAQAEAFNAAAKVQARKLRSDAYAAREKVRKAKWQAEHRAQCTEYLREWKKRTGFDSAEYQREWMAAHPGKRAEYHRRWRAKHREEINARNRAKYAAAKAKEAAK